MAYHPPDFFGAEQEIQTLLNTITGFDSKEVVIERPYNVNAERNPWVGIYCQGWRRADRQRISKDKKLLIDCTFHIWTHWMALDYDPNGLARAQRNAMSFVRQVEVKLLANPKLNGLVSSSWLESGDMGFQGDDDAMWAQMPTLLHCRMTGRVD